MSSYDGILGVSNNSDCCTCCLWLTNLRHFEGLHGASDDWNDEVDCPEVMGPYCLISEGCSSYQRITIRIKKTAGPTGVVREMMKASGGFGTSWMTDLINNIEEGCIPDDRRIISWCLCKRGRMIHLCEVNKEVVWHNIQGYQISLTTSQVQEAIKQSKNNNSQGPDKLNIRHLKHIGPLGLAFLTSMFKTAVNKNIIPHTWKLANIVPISKPNKDTDKGTSYSPYPSSQ